MGQLNGKVAWVTGAGSGIGEAAALALAGEGATLALTGRRREPLEDVAKRCRALGVKAEVFPADLTVAAQVDAACAGVVAAFGRLDILVSNAGANIVDRHWAKISAEGIDTLIHFNLSSAMYCARAVLPQMRKQGGGLLINTASMAGRNTGGFSGPGYQAAKHGVVAMSHSINQEECINGIRSTALLPGEVNTPILKQRPIQLTPEELGRMLQPEDTGEVVRWIACQPAHVCINEIWVTPAWNRSYVAALQRKL